MLGEFDFGKEDDIVHYRVLNDEEIIVYYNNGDVNYIYLNEESLKWVKEQMEKYMQNALEEFKDYDFDEAIKVYRLKKIKSVLKVDKRKSRQYTRDINKLKITKDILEKFQLYFDNIHMFEDGVQIKQEILGNVCMKAEPNKLKMFTVKEIKKALISESFIRSNGFDIK